MAGKLPSHDPAVAKLVEKQMRNWELGKAQRLAVPEPKRHEVEDFIAISRAVGAGGRELARKLGQKLDWPVFDKEILDAMAGDDEVRRALYDSMDERDLGWCEEAFRSLMQPEFVKNDYFHRLTRTILSLARQGRGVFLGRGAHLILPQDRGFRVRLVAPLDKRIGRFARVQNLTVAQARAEVRRIEDERAEFIRHHFRTETSDATCHDLTLNVDRISLDHAVELVLSTRALVGNPSSQT